MSLREYENDPRVIATKNWFIKTFTEFCDKDRESFVIAYMSAFPKTGNYSITCSTKDIDIIQWVNCLFRQFRYSEMEEDVTKFLEKFESTFNRDVLMKGMFIG